MRRETEQLEVLDRKSFVELIEHSSLGGPGARALRENTSRDDARRVMARAAEVAREKQRERVPFGHAPKSGETRKENTTREVIATASSGIVTPFGAANATAQWIWIPLEPKASVGRSRRALELYESAQRAASTWRPHEAALKLRRAAGMLEGCAGGEHIELRIRILLALSWSDMEIHGVANGLDRLRSAEELLSATPNQAGLELTGSVRAQQAMLLMRAGQFDKSIEVLDEAVQISEQAYARSESNHVRLGTHLFNRARAHIAAGNAGPAQADLLRCVDLAELGRRDRVCGGAELAELRAHALHSLGTLARRIGDVPLALRHFEEARDSYRELPGKVRFRIRMDMAEALLAAGLAEQAARHLDHALSDKDGTQDTELLADVYALRAAIALANGDLNVARRYARDARRLFLRQDNRVWAGIVAVTELRADVAVALDLGCVSAALPAQAIALAGELDGLRLVDEAAIARLLAVRLLLAQGAVAPAVELLDRVPQPRRVAPAGYRVLLRLCKAEVAVATGNRQMALSQARAGLSEPAELLDSGHPVCTVSNVGADVRELGRLALRVAVRVGAAGSGARTLFNWSERVRIEARRHELPLPTNDPILIELVQEYRHVGRILQEARLTNRSLRNIAARHRELGRELRRLRWRSRAMPAAAALDEIADRLGERALISYLTVDGEIIAVAVVGGRAELVRLGSAASAFDAARELHADLAALAPDGLVGPLANAVAASARLRAERLDTQLLRPLLSITGDRELVVVPTGALFAVAWGVLPTLHGRPITVVPSASAWLNSMTASAEGNGGRTVLVGGPGLSPAATGELGRLRQDHPDAWLFDGEHATAAIVLEALDGAGLAHLVADGVHEPQNALFSRLELADGPLYAHEMAGLRRPPRHLILAACEQALSRLHPDAEALGFAGVMLSAGAQTVIAAVSRVGDEAAAATMTEYHRRLGTGMRPAEALAAAVAEDPLRRPFLCIGASVSDRG